MRFSPLLILALALFAVFVPLSSGSLSSRLISVKVAVDASDASGSLDENSVTTEEEGSSHQAKAFSSVPTKVNPIREFPRDPEDHGNTIDQWLGREFRLKGTVDWRNNLRVWDLQQCRTSQSVAFTSAIEALRFMKRGKFVPLSARNVIACAPPFSPEEATFLAKGCDGEYSDRVTASILDHPLVPDRHSSAPIVSDATLAAVPKSCEHNPNGVAVASLDILKSREAVKEALKSGPVVAYWYHATTDSIKSYHEYFTRFTNAEGLFNPVCPAGIPSTAEIHHHPNEGKAYYPMNIVNPAYSRGFGGKHYGQHEMAVTIAGYGQLSTGIDYYIVTPHLGRSWGDRGYIYVQAGDVKDCGLSNSAVKITLKEK